MDVIKDLRKQFRDHKATLTDFESPNGLRIQHLQWRKPGTGIFSIVYMTIMGDLIVRGDLGEAIYCVTGRQSLEFWAGNDITYFKKKCRASEGGRGSDWNEWSQQQCHRCIEEYVQQHYHADGEEPDQELYEMCMDAAWDKRGFEDWLLRYGPEFMG